MNATDKYCPDNLNAAQGLRGERGIPGPLGGPGSYGTPGLPGASGPAGSERIDLTFAAKPSAASDTTYPYIETQGGRYALSWLVYRGSDIFSPSVVSLAVGWKMVDTFYTLEGYDQCILNVTITDLTNNVVILDENTLPVTVNDAIFDIRGLIQIHDFNLDSSLFSTDESLWVVEVRSVPNNSNTPKARVYAFQMY